mmetsp:Transcript_24277/g.74916  ORF Transcript_24277/g.74916 Transcript_24277/m.74916 type:complete len:89 (-) Transcript_24277:1071-1337(-)
MLLYTSRSAHHHVFDKRVRVATSEHQKPTGIAKGKSQDRTLEGFMTYVAYMMHYLRVNLCLLCSQCSRRRRSLKLHVVHVTHSPHCGP